MKLKVNSRKRSWASALSAAIALLCLALLAACGATAPKKPAGPPPPQNLVGSTDQLQLVTELSLNLAREYGASRLLVVLGVDGTLLAGEESSAACEPGDMTTLQAMQEDSAEQVQRVRDAGIPLLLVTRRDSSCADKTRAQLAAIGMAESGEVLYTNGAAKGPALNAMLRDRGDTFPMLIIMADNQQPNLSSVMKEFSSLGTKVHSWRYTRPLP